MNTEWIWSAAETGRTRVWGPTLVLLAGLWGCASVPSPAEQGLSAPMEGGPEEPEEPAVSDAEAPLKNPADRCLSLQAPGVVKRSAVNQVVDQGLGQWLRGVKVEPKLEKGKFKGWLVHSLHITNPCYAAVDIQPGDLVFAVNGQSIEKPDAVHTVWNTLKTADGIQVDLLRAGQRQSVRFEIAADAED